MKLKVEVGIFCLTGYSGGCVVRKCRAEEHVSEVFYN